jgi:hypothetical protein
MVVAAILAGIGATAAVAGTGYGIYSTEQSKANDTSPQYAYNNYINSLRQQDRNNAYTDASYQDFLKQEQIRNDFTTKAFQDMMREEQDQDVNQRNDRQYNQALVAEGLRRSTSGYTDSEGNAVTYDPQTNTWKTTLGPSATRVQQASDNASVSRNTTDLRAAQRANANAAMQAVIARSSAEPARAAIENFRPMDAATLSGLLQDKTTQANRASQDPIIADTLRQFARTGTAAGPVLDTMMRTNAQGLRDTVRDNTISAMTSAPQVNQANLANLTGKYAALSAGSTPSLQFSQLSTQNPRDTLASLMASRAQGAGSAPASLAYATRDTGVTGGGRNLSSALSGLGSGSPAGLFSGINGATSGVNSASDLGARFPVNNNIEAIRASAFGDKINSIGDKLSSKDGSFAQLLKYMTSGGKSGSGPTSLGNAPNPTTYQPTGTAYNPTAFGYSMDDNPVIPGGIPLAQQAMSTNSNWNWD